MIRPMESFFTYKFWQPLICEHIEWFFHLNTTLRQESSRADRLIGTQTQENQKIVLLYPLFWDA